MRKLKLIEHISLDGVIQHSADGDDFPYSDWTVPYRTPAGRDALLVAYGTGFDLLLGRRTYDIWSDFWPKAPAGPMADGLNAATKYVATHRPESLGWGPCEALGPDVIDGVRRIKSHGGPDLVLSGSSTLTSTLLDHGLADEVVLVVYPVLLGTGKRFFAEGTPGRAGAGEYEGNRDGNPDQLVQGCPAVEDHAVDPEDHVTETSRPAHAGVHFPPPLLYAAGLVAGVSLNLWHPLPMTLGSSPVRTTVGVAGIIAYVVIFLAAFTAFRRSRTTLIPNRPASALVTGGPYRFTRNPMYVSLVMLYIGLSAFANSWWPVLLLPLVVVAIDRGVITREERYLDSAFPAEYGAYRSRVRRWL